MTTGPRLHRGLYTDQASPVWSSCAGKRLAAATAWRLPVRRRLWRYLADTAGRRTRTVNAVHLQDGQHRRAGRRHATRHRQVAGDDVLPSASSRQARTPSRTRYFPIDSTGAEFGGGGFNLTLRDMARFGEMIRLGGRSSGRQIVTASVIEDIRKGGDRTQFCRRGLQDAAWLELSHRSGGCRTTPTAPSPAAASTGRGSTSIRRRKW